MHYKINKAQNIVLCKPQQDFSFEQLFAHLQQLLEDPDFYPGINGFYDFSAVEHVTGDLEALMKTAETIEDKVLLPLASKVAIVVQAQKHNLYKIFEGYCLMASSSNVKYKLFTLASYSDALSYVELEDQPRF